MILKRKISRCTFVPFLTVLLTLSSGCNQSNIDKSATREQQKTAQETANISNSSARVGKTKIVTTFLPVYLFTKAVAGDVADVEILVPPGSEVHEYQATPDNIKAIATANVLVINGLGLEEFLAKSIKNVQNPKLLQIDTSKGIKVLAGTSPIIKTVKAARDHEHETGNPHIWLDPVLAKQQIINIRDGLITADPSNQATYQANAAAYIQQLESLNNEFQQTLQKTPNCTFITFHDAFIYLAKRYNLQQVAVVEVPEDQLSPADVKNVVNAVKKYQVKALFSEPGVDNKLLQSLSQDLKLTLQTLNSIETGDKDPQYYFQAMKTNLQTLSKACK